MLSHKQILTPLLTFTLCAAAFSASACASDDDSASDGTDGAGGAVTAGGGGPAAGGGTAAGGTDTGAGGGEAIPIYCATPTTCPPSIDGVDMTTPVSFRNDLYPNYFAVGCGDSGCHNSISKAADMSFVTRVDTDYTPLTDEEISALILQLTTVPSIVAPGTMSVVPGDWENSFLMMKLDGCQNSHNIACDQDSQWLNPISYNVCKTVCGGGMPLAETAGNNTLPFATTPAELAMVNKVRAWIAQGALDN